MRRGTGVEFTKQKIERRIGHAMSSDSTLDVSGVPPTDRRRVVMLIFEPPVETISNNVHIARVMSVFNV